MLAMSTLAVGEEGKPMSDDATLKSLAVSCGDLSPGFVPSKGTYVTRAPHRVDTVTMTPTLSDLEASLTVNGAPAASGEAFGPVPLAVGRNMIPVEVTAADGQTKRTYTAKIIRAYPTPTWVQVRDSSPWLPRDSEGELVFDGKMWIFGGYTPEVINDVWCSSDGVEWTNVGTIPNDSGVNIPVNFVYDGTMWVATNDGNFYNSVDGADWTLVTDAAPWRGRYAAGGAVFADRMWVMGGFKKGELFNDIWSSANGVNWTLETDNAPWSKRQVFSMVAVHDNALWIMGGGITMYHPFKAYRDVWKSTDGRNWTKVTDEAPWAARIWGASAVYRNRLWILGGFHSEPVWENLGRVWYSGDGADWNELVTETAWSPRHELSAYVFDGKLWVVAGNSWPLKNDVWCLDLPGLVFLSQPVVEEFVTAQYTYRARADFNASGGDVRYRLVDGPAWLSVDAETGLVRGTPDVVGDCEVILEAFDDAGETARQTYTLHVLSLG
jgi:Cadherin-like beta sandwich domain/Putative Ig domain